ncbi:MAG: hypothetical protein GY946_13635, partial [bacterium]|nr:hypothetical protein [bacterium]
VVLSSANGNAITIGDPDGTAAVLDVTLMASAGRMTLASTSGLSMLVGSGADDAVVSFQGSLTNISQAIDGMTFVANGEPGSQTIEVGVEEPGMGGRVALATVDVNIDSSPVYPEIPEIDLLPEVEVTPTPEPPAPEPSTPVETAEEVTQDAAQPTSKSPNLQMREPVFMQSLVRLGASEIDDVVFAVQESLLALVDLEARASFDRASGEIPIGKESLLGTTWMHPELLNTLDQMRREVLESEASDRDSEDWVMQSVQGVAMAMTTGVFALLMRGGSLFAMAVSSIPMWKRMDPLMILSLSDADRHDLASTQRAAEKAERDLEAVLEGQGEDVE